MFLSTLPKRWGHNPGELGLDSFVLTTRENRRYCLEESHKTGTGISFFGYEHRQGSDNDVDDVYTMNHRRVSTVVVTLVKSFLIVLRSWKTRNDTPLLVSYVHYYCLRDQGLPNFM